mmetsp:Transcript_62867/g.199160  ORF Transcript_62867/g.199160 Transcript_62867/m.199160 type:complete len:283 (+) Transcript_62867:34-882(+)
MNASAIAGGRFAAGPALREGSRARPRASSALDVRAGRRISAPRTSSLAADRGAMMASRHCAISAARPRGLIVRSAAADAGGLSSGGGGDVPADVQAALYKLCCPGEGVQLLTGEARGEAPPIDTTAVLRSAGMGLLAMGAAVHTGGLAGAWTDLTSNKVFMCGFWAWLLAQVLKVRGCPAIRAPQGRSPCCPSRTILCREHLHLQPPCPCRAGIWPPSLTVSTPACFLSLSPSPTPSLPGVHELPLEALVGLEDAHGLGRHAVLALVPLCGRDHRHCDDPRP